MAADQSSFPVLNFQDFISADGDQLFTSTLQVAAAFGKRHDRVLRALRSLMSDLPADFNGPNFGVVECFDAKGESRVAYRITRDGFTLLAMGFTGKKAVAFKLAYINAFNGMAAYIKNQREGLRYRCALKELEVQDSEKRGSLHGRGLNQRRLEKPVLESELAMLQVLVQPSLLQ